MKRSNLTLSALVLVNFLLRLFVALRPLKYIDGYTVPDDAYLALTLARNIAKGLGPHYGLDYTNGFQPLYVFLMAPIYWFYPNDIITPVHLSLIMLALFDTATLFLIYKIVKRFSESPITPVIAAVAWIVNPYVMRTAANGMETSISLFLIALVVHTYDRYKSEELPGNGAIAFAFGLLLGLAILARIDNGFLAGLVIAGIVILAWREKTPAALLIKNLLLIGAGVFFAYLPWFLYSLHYTGDIIPVSGKAVRYLSLSAVDHKPTFSNWYLVMLYLAGGTIAKHNLALIILMAGLVYLSKWPRPSIAFNDFYSKARPYNILLIFCLVLLIFYTFYTFGAWYLKRYLYPLALLLLLYLSAMIDLYNSRLKKTGRIIFNAAVLAFLLISCLVNPAFHDFYFGTETQTMGHMNLGLWARSTFPDGTVIGSSQTGALGYFAQNQRIINLDGVVNQRCYKSLIQKRAIEYMRSVRVEYFVDWPNNYTFITKESRSFRPDDMQFMYEIRDFTSWNNEWCVWKVKP